MKTSEQRTGSGWSRLVEFLRSAGAIGERKAMGRTTVAGCLDVPVRKVRAWSEAARLAGEFVVYSESGLFLAETDGERWGILERIRRESLRRLRQYQALKRAVMARGQAELFPQTPADVFRRRGESASGSCPLGG